MRIPRLLLATAFAAISPVLSAQDVRVVTPAAADVVTPEGSRWARAVEVDVEEFARAAMSASTVLLDVGAGVAYRMSADRVAWRGARRFTWFGALAGGGRATVTVEGDRVFARLHGRDGLVMIEPTPGGHVAHRPRPVDGEGDDTLAPPRYDGAGAGGGGDELFPDELHLAIFYTSQVADSLGDGLEVFLQATSDQLSDVFANSNVDFRARLVLTGQVVHTETQQLSGNLSMIQDPNDGVMDEVHELRDEASADFVALLVETGTNSATGCGVAYLMSSLDPGFESAAFSVTKRRCAPELVFSHEVGHNLGLHHDIFVAPGPGLFPYSHGFVNIDSMNVPPGRPGIRTPLAYHSWCATNGGECVRIPYFSTVEQLYNGQVIGDAATADNVRTVRQSAALGAGFRAPVVHGTFTGDTGSGQTWQRPACTDPSDMSTCTLSGTATEVRYSVTPLFGVTRSGRHYVRSEATFDGVLLLYDGTFNPASPLTGLLGYAEPDPSAPLSRRLLLSTELSDVGPTLVIVTTGMTNGDAGTFENDFFGPTGGGVVVFPGTEDGPSAAGLTISPPRPNPGSGRVSLSVTVADAQHVRVELVDGLGRTVAVLHDGPVAARTTLPVEVDARSLAPGAYIMRAVGEAGSKTRLITVLR